MTSMRSVSISFLALLALSLASPPGCYSVGFKKPAAAANSGASQAAAAVPENMEIRDKWAVVVGVNRYIDPAIPPLKFAQKSSADLARALKDTSYGHFALNHVLVLNGPEASKAAIEQAFEDWLYKKAMPDDFVVIYFNTRMERNGAGEPIICANDTQASDPDGTGINLSELLSNARKRVGSTHMLCLLDTNPLSETDKYAAGSEAKDANAGANHDLKSLASFANMAVLSAAELGKRSLDDDADMQSYFSHFFVEALKTGGANFPVGMVAEYVWQKIQETTRNSGTAGQTALLSLGKEHSRTVDIPLGIMVRSAMPPKPIKTIKVGRPVEDTFDHPNLAAAVPSRPVANTINLQPRNHGLPFAKDGSPSDFVVESNQQEAALSGTQSTGQTIMALASGAATGVLPAKVKPKASTTASSAKQQAYDDEDDDVNPNLDLTGYVNKIKQDIQKKWQLPKGFESKRVTTVFSIMRDGKIENAAVVESSGTPAIDKSALDALKSASPLDPLPKGAPESIDLKYSFDWKTKIGKP